MSKIIIENRTDMDDSFCMGLVQRVVNDGRVSNYGKQYCYLTTFHLSGKGEINVSASLNKKSDKFIVWRESK